MECTLLGGLFVPPPSVPVGVLLFAPPDPAADFVLPDCKSPGVVSLDWVVVPFGLVAALGSKRSILAPNPEPVSSCGH